MGSVWLAEDTRLNRQVALKTLRAADEDDAPARARLMREARAAAALNHPNNAAVYDVLESDGQIVIVFEYVEGETLAARIARDPMPPAEAVEFGCQIAKALVVAHASGIVHRDLKPANVIVGAGGQLKVLDFGIARMLAIGTTQTSASQTASGLGLIGTPAYAAPEQMVTAAVDERADLYALGVMLFEMISGQRPFAGHDPVALASSKLSSEAPGLRSTGALVPRPLELLVRSLLAREREQRPPSAAVVLRQLQDVYGPPRPARSVAAMLAGVVLLAVVAGFGVREIRRMAAVEAPANGAPPVVAVLPLDNMSGDSSRLPVSGHLRKPDCRSRLVPVPHSAITGRGRRGAQPRSGTGGAGQGPWRHLFGARWRAAIWRSTPRDLEPPQTGSVDCLGEFF
jgi:hypothetical protein